MNAVSTARPENPRACANASTGAATGAAGWMMVSRWVSSKSSRLADIALRNDAPIASSRSGRPITDDVAAPLNGNNVRNAAVTAGSFADPSAVAKKFRIERFAS